MNGLLNKNDILCNLFVFKEASFVSEIRVDSKGFRRFAMILVRILYEDLQSDMGRKREKFERLESLGMRTRKVEFVPPLSF